MRDYAEDIHAQCRYCVVLANWNVFYRTDQVPFCALSFSTNNVETKLYLLYNIIDEKYFFNKKIFYRRRIDRTIWRRCF